MNILLEIGRISIIYRVDVAVLPWETMSMITQ